jgi:hypothetical protein
MGSKFDRSSDWVRLNQDRYLSEDSSQEAMDALQHVLAARAAVEVGENEVALFMYARANRIWRNMEKSEPGKWKEEIVCTASESLKISS